MDLSLIKQLDQEQFLFFRDIVYRESGIKMNEAKTALLQSRIMRRMRILNLNSYDAYMKYLQNNYDDEITNFINAMTTNKTDFFREGQHFEYLKSVVFPEFESAGKKEIRIWSAGCSTGEEPYTIAMTVHDYFRDRKNINLKILATDIDTQVLTKAYEGIYKADVLAELKADYLKEYFFRGTGANAGSFKVKPFLHDMITFRRLNLLDGQFPMKNRINIIFCRNVIIYFDKETQKRLFEKMYNVLADDGYLFIGHSENLSNVNPNFRHLGRTIYRKVLCT
jgi:chemotaxis protein methyltransferase CheR